MIGVRPVFDPDRPFEVEAGSLVYGGRRFRRGEPFPWRDLGIGVGELGQLWYAFKVVNTRRGATSAVTPTTPPSPEIIPGERPSADLTRRERRALRRQR